MISFDTPIRYKYYLLANFYRMFDRTIEKIFLTFFVLLILINVLYEDLLIASSLIGIVLFFYIGIPLIRYVYVRIHFKAEKITYFFDTDSFGYETIGYKVEIKRDLIQHINVKINRLVIKTEKQNLYFVGDPMEIVNTKKLLEQSNYKTLVK